MLMQQLLQLLDKTSLAVVLLLAGDIPPCCLHPAGADAEHRIALLPCKLRFVLARCPHRGCLLELAHKVRKAVRRLEADQGVDVVLDTTDLQRHAAQSAHGAAEVFMQSGPPIWSNERAALLGRTDPVVMQAVVSRTHVRKVPARSTGAMLIPSGLDWTNPQG